ncbi:MAG: hypothetical protein V3R52_08210 [Candidatus Neomarinimicrobiota bacterium]
MEKFNYFIIARALHVFGVVIWIGGVAFVTTILIPSLKRMTNAQDKLELFKQLEGKFSFEAKFAFKLLKLELFEQLEGKFSFEAKFVTLITGVSGIFMLEFLSAWGRFLQLQYWWMHLMIFVWILFTIVLFVLEPLFLHRWFREQANKDSDKSFALLHRFHIILLTLSLIAVLGAVAGSHGFKF